MNNMGNCQLSKYFDKKFCINLDRRPDRWDIVSDEFNKWGIKDVERVSAVDGKTVEQKKGLLPGELGILMTHIDLIKRCKKDGYDTVLIMEDDVYFTDELQNIDSYMNAVPNDWEILFLGGNHVYAKPPFMPIKINDKILKVQHTVALHCVAIKSSIFDVLIAVLSTMNKQVDGLYCNVEKCFSSYCVYPNIALQTENFSDIQNRIANYDHFLKRNI